MLEYHIQSFHYMLEYHIQCFHYMLEYHIQVTSWNLDCGSPRNEGSWILDSSKPYVYQYSALQDAPWSIVSLPQCGRNRTPHMSQYPPILFTRLEYHIHMIHTPLSVLSICCILFIEQKTTISRIHYKR